MRSMTGIKAAIGAAVLAGVSSSAYSQVYINEYFFNPSGSDSGATFGHEYVELRGPASGSLAGTYLIFLEGDSGTPNPGQIQNVFDLTGYSLGTNGFLAIRQKFSPFTVAPGATDVINSGTGNGFGNGISSSIGHTAQGTAVDIENLSHTAMLINIGVGAAPVVGQDLDTGDDGLDLLPAGWSILDSIALLDGGTSDRGYGNLVYSQNANGLFDAGATFVNVGFSEIEYVERFGDSTGQTAADWVVSDTFSTVSGTPPWTITAGETTNALYAGQVVGSHLGTHNPIPEPSTLTLLGAFAAPLLRRRRKA